jgi:GNAT superfamily N-acetyltransferase
MNIEIRKASMDDVPSLYNLVYELAVFEKEPDALTTNLESYQEAFGEKLIDAIVAVDGDVIVGMVLFYMTFSTWKGKSLYLEDFYVKEAYRKFGIGQSLFDAYLEEAKARGAQMTKWQVLDWNEVGINFYKKNNAVIESNWWNGKIYF